MKPIASLHKDNRYIYYKYNIYYNIVTLYLLLLYYYIIIIVYNNNIFYLQIIYINKRIA